jgi:predicted acyltransferase
LLGYWAVMTLIPVPGFGVGELSAAHKDGNLGAFIDRWLVGGRLGGKTWDVTGLFGFWPATVNVLAGTLVGNVLTSGRRPGGMIGIMSTGGIAMTLVGWLWGGCPDFTGFLMLGEPALTGPFFPINKPLWTSSFVVLTTGLGCIALACCYLLVDVLGLKAWSLPFRVFGLNPLLAFMGAGMLNSAMRKLKLENGATLHETIYKTVFLPLADPHVASLLYAVTYVLLWLGIMGVLYRRRIVVKI